MSGLVSDGNPSARAKAATFRCGCEVWRFSRERCDSSFAACSKELSKELSPSAMGQTKEPDLCGRSCWKTQIIQKHPRDDAPRTTKSQVPHIFNHPEPETYGILHHFTSFSHFILLLKCLRLSVSDRVVFASSLCV